MPSIFDSTAKFNPEVWVKALENLKSTDKVEMVAFLKRNNDTARIANMFPEQGGGNVATIAIEGNLGGTAQNYDGSTTIVPNNVINYSQTVIAIGRVNAWKEKDFIPSISGRSGIDAQAFQVALARDKNVKASALSILGAMFDASNGVLKNRVLAKTAVTVTDMNDAIVQACGDLGNEFDVVVMDSYYAGQLANAKLLDYAKYNDEEGIERVSHEIAYWGGKLVVIDDAVGTNSAIGTHYVYAFGFRSFKYAELPVKYPYEMARDSFTAGGVDSLISRMRYVLAPYGVSWAGSSSIVSPTEEQLATATNWALVTGADGNAISTKIIPFACLKCTISE